MCRGDFDACGRREGLAYVGYYTILGNPALSGIGPAGVSSVTLLNNSGGSIATLLLEETDVRFRNANIFGIYNLGSPAEKLTLFAGADEPKKSVEVSFDGAQAWITGDKTTAVDMGTSFGFYLVSPAGTFYTDTSLNKDGGEHGLIYSTSSYAIGGNPDVVVAFEDGSGSGYDAMVVGITNVTSGVTLRTSSVTVPVPGAFVLGSIGLSIVSWMRRKKSL